jgi:glycosyltransferase involved in cell wall biosynthesis|tara:strand:- start:691 stop:1359 length:669 start_codon:yes stop_codon:yes gene_type:complete
MKDLTLVIPAKQEKESLPEVLDELISLNLKTIVILEKTDLETIESLKNYNCEILYQNNTGYGDALIQGINHVRTKYFCIFNADGSFNPNELKNMYKILDQKSYDLVFASRYEKNAGSEDDTIVTFIGNKIFSFIGKIFFRLPISDILYTFVMGDAEKVNKVELKNKDFSFCVELPIKSYRSKLKLSNFASIERKRIAGKKKVNAIKDGLKILFSMIALFFKK